MNQVAQPQKHAVTNRVLFTRTNEKGQRVCETKSKSSPNKKYEVNVDLGTCTCPAWKYYAWARPCKHLKALGFHHINGPQPDAEDQPVPNPSMNYKILSKGDEDGKA